MIFKNSGIKEIMFKLKALVFEAAVINYNLSEPSIRRNNSPTWLDLKLQFSRGLALLGRFVHGFETDILLIFLIFMINMRQKWECYIPEKWNDSSKNCTV